MRNLNFHNAGVAIKQNFNWVWNATRQKDL
jgi:hypothetical protein